MNELKSDKEYYMSPFLPFTAIVLGLLSNSVCLYFKINIVINLIITISILALTFIIGIRKSNSVVTKD